MTPCSPNIDSITSIATSSSQARALICEPMILAFRKYSSLWITTMNASETSAICSECESPTTTSTELEIRLPITGSSPAKKVIAVMVFDSGKRKPDNGRMMNK